MSPKVYVKIIGRRALFTDPATRLGGEKFTYDFPTYSALVGILSGIYWKPTFTWKINKCRILNKISTETVNVITNPYNNAPRSLCKYTYLVNPTYEIEAEMVWNENLPQYQKDRDYKKHLAIFKRHLKNGGKQDLFLGTRECVAFAETTTWGAEKGYYDDKEISVSGYYFHSFVYPSIATKEEEKRGMTTLLWQPVIKKGVIYYTDPDDISVRKVLNYELD